MGFGGKKPIQSRLNKPYMEVKGNQTTRNISINAQTVLKNTVVVVVVD